MDKEVERADRRARRSVFNVPSFVREEAGVSSAGPSTAVPFGTDFNEEDVSDGGDVTEGTVSPGAFLRMATGLSRTETTETEKPLPPLPSSVSPPSCI